VGESYRREERGKCRGAQGMKTKGFGQFLSGGLKAKGPSNTVERRIEGPGRGDHRWKPCQTKWQICVGRSVNFTHGGDWRDLLPWRRTKEKNRQALRKRRWRGGGGQQGGLNVGYRVGGVGGTRAINRRREKNLMGGNGAREACGWKRASGLQTNKKNILA